MNRPQLFEKQRGAFQRERVWNATPPTDLAFRTTGAGAGVLAVLAVLLGLGFARSSTAADVKQVHLLVPGFTVEEVPVRLPNVNNLRFAPDGSLTALGYNGKVWKLRDTDGDGMEDTASVWWDKSPLTVPVGMNWSTHGLYVSSSGRVSLLKDTDGDDVADTEDVVASGWPGKDTASGNVDATGVTLDDDGNLYFGLLTANYANPYRLKPAGELTAAERAWLKGEGRAIPDDPGREVSLYDLNGMRGSVQTWNATTRELETIATGVRVPYHFAFNRAGDLFMTDQEGETWCPGGNPLDELNHIVRGRNYGFPPRHERWLPDLASEEPVVGFGPQHQSACGFVFNEPHAALNRDLPPRDGAVPLPAGPARGLFGPDWWEGDAFVVGQSRGKIWRVRLAKTERGYTGKSHLIARLSMLTTDVAISPAGALYVSCHSGLPDWGTGPNGEGKVFRIRYTDPQAPQPVDVTAVSPTQVRVRFDRPVDASVVRANVGMRIEFGDAVRAADRLEVLKPPYSVVARQEAEPRQWLEVESRELREAGRTLVLETAPHARRTAYAFSLANVKAPGRAGEGDTIDLAYDLSSAEFANWTFSEVVRTPPRLSSADKPAGDYETGRALFFSDNLQCATCHRLRGNGRGDGPDLSNLTSRDVDSVLRDIRDPDATINPDYVGYNVTMKDGEEHSGFVRREGNDRLKVTAATGAETVIHPTDIAEMRPAGTSLMPTGLLDGLNDSQINDLLTYLLHEPPKREAADLRRMLKPSASASVGAGVASPVEPPADVNVVLVASKQDHGTGQHDYPAWQESWHQLLSTTPRVVIEDAWLWPTDAQFAAADALIFYYWNRAWDDAKYAQLDAFQARGGGVVVLHSATIEGEAPEKLAARIGLAAQPGTVKYRHMPFDLRLVDRTHPITTGLPETIHFLDEPYWPMIGDLEKIHVLATAVNVDGADRPMMWTYERNGGRVFASIAGHYTWTLDDSVFRLMILRGLDWVTGDNRFANSLLPERSSP